MVESNRSVACGVALLLASASLNAQPPPPPPPPPPLSAPEPEPAAPTEPTEPTEPPTAPVPAQPVLTDPIVLHARGLALVLEGKPKQALPLLRQAYSRAPESELFAFDLARIARAHGGSPQDQRVILAVEPTTAATRLLQAYVLLDGGDIDGALARVEAVLAAEPEHAEAGALLRILRPGAPAPTSGGLEVERAISKKEPARFTGRLRLSGVLDSNVTVLPDDAPTHQQGYRLQVNGAALVNLLRGDLTADVGAAVLYGPHVTDRDAGATPLGELDLFAVVGLVTLEHRTRALIWDADISGTEVFLDGFGEHFMQEIGAQMSARLFVGSAELGVYTAGGYRDYVGLNVEGSLYDRDGPCAAAGVVLKWIVGGGLGLDLRAGYQLERTDGTDMVERGPQARLIVRWRWRDLRVRGGVAWVMRDYVERGAANERTDQRLTPQLELRYSLTEWLALRGGWALTRNVSQESFDYSRHLGRVGMEATW